MTRRRSGLMSLHSRYRGHARNGIPPGPIRYRKIVLSIPAHSSSTVHTTPRSPSRRRRTARGSGQPAAGHAPLSVVDDLFGLEVAPVDPTAPVPSWRALGVPAKLVEALQRGGLVEPFPIQARTLPDALAGRDLLGRGRTGSGKTLAFGLPMLTRLAAEGVRPQPRRPRSLILVPTRELAAQVDAVLAPLAQVLGLRTRTVVGGVGFGRQVDSLARGVDVLVATPGRLADLISQGTCDLGGAGIVVLDEADQMCDLGFLPAVRKLLAMCPPGQRLLFSATLDRQVTSLVREHLHDPVVHALSAGVDPVVEMEHHVLFVEGSDKPDVVKTLARRVGRTLMFVRTKHGADRLAGQLSRDGIPTGALHGNLAQNARTRALAAFADGSVPVLVATDVAARGLHVDDIDLVVHVDPPTEHKTYLHRSGRTARAGATGRVVTLVLPDQQGAVRGLLKQASVAATPVRTTPRDDYLLDLRGEESPLVPWQPPVRTVPVAAGAGRGRQARPIGQGGRGHAAGRSGRRPR